MNAEDVIKYGHRTVMHTIQGLPEAEIDVGGVCGIWSVKDIMAHLTSHELVLLDVFNSFLGVTETPHFDAYGRLGFAFNDIEVDNRKDIAYSAIVREYEDAHAELSKAIARIPVETRRQAGTLPWYGAEYDLEDLIAYSNYGHKREHTAQINVYRDLLKAKGVLT
jgi:hypothetical protein